MATDSAQVEGRDGQIATQCERMEGLQQDLLSTIERLENRLHQIIAPVTATEAKASPPQQDLVPHAAFLASRNEVLQGAIDRLHSMTQRIEL